MRVLVACEFSGVVREAFRKRGHDAWSCDLLPTYIPSDYHIQSDALELLSDGWDLLIAHPPCTYLSRAGNRSWNNPGRAELRQQALEFFMKFINAPIEKICVENPVGYPNTEYIKPDQIIHPYYFGDRELKRTCLWLKNLPKLFYIEHDSLFSEIFQPLVMTEYPQPHAVRLRGKKIGKPKYFMDKNRNPHIRSKTFQGIAEAMATQWGCLK